MSLFRAEKGEYGYRDCAKRKKILITLLLILAIIVQLLIRTFTSMSVFRTLFTLSAILTVIPLGVIASPLLASWKYKTPDIGFYEEIHPYEERFLILYDLILTTKEMIIPLDVVVVHPIGVYAYCSDKKLDEKKTESGLDELFASCGRPFRIHIMKDYRNFKKRLDALKPASECEDDGSVEAEAGLLKNLCM